ncbi:MAG: hypothetical protein I3273_04050 [Candidatus Moeniiplasma glomeromycotorum]|nr:hypothetical protein [Candidatus Moeniiplasma glomeromycotorum]
MADLKSLFILPFKMSEKQRSCWVKCNKCKKALLRGDYKDEWKKGKWKCLNTNCEEYLKQGRNFEILKPSVEEIEGHWLKQDNKLGFRKAYYLTDDYLVVEFDKTDEPDFDYESSVIYTTDSESGLFLGYEDISENSSLSEAVESAKKMVQQTLTKLNIEIKKLSEKFWNWQEDISKLQSVKEVKIFFNNLFKEAHQQFIEQSKEQPISEKKEKKFPYWMFIPISFLVVIVIGIIVYCRKKKQSIKKQKK